MKKQKKVLSSADVLKRVSNNKKTILVEEWGESIEITMMTLSDMVSLKELDEKEQQAKIISVALGISNKKALEIYENNNGMEFAPIHAAINKAYMVTDDEVKKP